MSPSLASLRRPAERPSARALPPNDSATPIGPTQRVIGRWRPTKLISRTQHITIYRAAPLEDRISPGCYALKTTTGQSDDRLARAMLGREVLTTAEVSHPHLASVLAADCKAAPAYVVFPYLEGVSLRQLFDRSANAAAKILLPTSYVLSAIRQTASALTAMHDAGWLHGQVRPEHVVVSPQGHATLIDLTQARKCETAEVETASASPGASAYAAPELFAARGRHLAASDIYALGVMLFELLTGRLPFMVTDPRRLAAAHRTEAPPGLRHFRPEASQNISELVRRMLAKEPFRRPDAAQLVRWLAELEIESLAA